MADPSAAATMLVVPDECLTAVETVEEVTELVRQGAAAIRDFQTAELRSLLRELETLDTKAREQVQACREVRTEESRLPSDPLVRTFTCARTETARPLG